MATLTVLGCAVSRLTVQLPDAGVMYCVGVQVNDLTHRSGVGSSGRVKLAEVPFRVATSTAFVAAVTTRAVTVNEALVAPAATVTDEGTLSWAELVATPRAMLIELVAAPPKLTVQTALANVTMDDGAQTSLETKLALVIVSVAPVVVPEMGFAALEAADKPVS